MLQIRTYRPTDLPGIVALINAAAAADGIEDGTSVTEMQSELSVPYLNPEENVFVAIEGHDSRNGWPTHEGRIVGYAILRFMPDTTTSSFRTWFQVHPEHRGRNLEDQLLERLYRRAEERLPECTSEFVDFYSFANVVERERLAAIERMGLREARRFWQMVRPTLSDLPEPQFPDGYLIRAYRTKEDDVPVFQADNDAFRDHWGYVPHPIEMWEHYITQPFIRHDLSLVVQAPASREVAGFCLVIVNDEENKRLGVRRGWIDILGVRRPYRRQGLGTAMLLAAMRNLRSAGLEQAALGCDSENITGATRIYERIGFRVAKTHVTLCKRMRGPAETEAALLQQQSLAAGK
jgi:mycothiol synthase